MRLTSAQHSQIAAAYERAAADKKLPPQPRAGFAKKAGWFRMLAEIAAAKEAVVGESADSYPDAKREPLLSVGFLVELLQVASSERHPPLQFSGTRGTKGTGSRSQCEDGD